MTSRPELIPPFDKDWLASNVVQAFSESQTTAYRLHTEPDGWVERYGDDVMISYKSEERRNAMLKACQDWSAANGITVRRIFGKFLPRQNADRETPILLEGEAGGALTTTVLEHGVRYGIDFAAGYSVGLFLDQRANRAYLRRRSPARVLNTFAYTCSFSVIGALAGAETLSVDLSKKSLDRGRANFALNSLDPARHRFFADDVLDVLPRLARRGELFDAIVLDPPTFSRGNKGSRFQVERDFETLLQAALEVATPRGLILLSTNCTRLDRRSLENIGRSCLKTARRQGTFHLEPSLPDIPSNTAATTLWLSLK